MTKTTEYKWKPGVTFTLRMNELYDGELGFGQRVHAALQEAIAFNEACDRFPFRSTRGILDQPLCCSDIGVIVIVTLDGE